MSVIPEQRPVAILGERTQFKGHLVEVVGIVEATHGAQLITVRFDRTIGPLGVLYCRCGLPGCPSTPKVHLE